MGGGTNSKSEQAEIIFYMSGAFKNAVDGRFLSQEHASALFKGLLRDAGYELAKKETTTLEK